MLCGDKPASAQSTIFTSWDPAVLQTIAANSTQQVTTSFADDGLANQANVAVDQRVLVFNEDGKRDFALSVYRITNRNTQTINTMYCGIYADWDIGPSGQNDVAIWSEPDGFYYCYNTQDQSLPYVGMQIVSDHQSNAFMIDNNGTTADNPGVYDGYTKAEKWRTISSGIGRTRSSVTDASAVIAAGPFSIGAGASEQVVFSIFAGRSLDELRSAAERARQTAQQVLGITPSAPQLPAVSARVLPNPITGDQLTVEYSLPDSGTLSIVITDALGQIIATALEPGFYPPTGRTTLSLPQVASGAYFAVVRSNRGTVAVPFVLIR